MSALSGVRELLTLRMQDMVGVCLRCNRTCRRRDDRPFRFSLYDGSIELVTSVPWIVGLYLLWGYRIGRGSPNQATALAAKEEP